MPSRHTPTPVRRRSVLSWASDQQRTLRPLINLSGDKKTILVRKKGNSFIIEGTGAGLDLSKFAFGWLGINADNPQAVDIRAGYIEGRLGYRIVSGATVNVGGNESAPHLIIVTFDDQGGVIEGNSVLESSFSGDTSDRWRRVLYRVYLRDGTPFMDMIGKGVGGIVP